MSEFVGKPVETSPSELHEAGIELSTAIPLGPREYILKTEADYAKLEAYRAEDSAN
jgi:hypothetical protein